MSLLSMRFLPDPILRRQARKIGKVPANMKKFTDDMIETMHDELGVGLAANQIGSLQKVAVIQLAVAVLFGTWPGAGAQIVAVPR